ncbi:DoxX family protein [Mucilaginibacter sp. 22184]|uniref:DoxX family protein n=1 Tax=Mucilaginibacter sp. 22184 TaxID=3453887 RepID=UPI003F854FDD
MKALLQQTIATEINITSLVLRLTLAIVLWPHGAQLLLGSFGGHGFSGSMAYFTSTGLPWIVAFLVIFLLFFGTIFILLGFGTRFFAIAFVILFLGMIANVHLQNGFFMNWFGNQKGEGFEYHLLLIGVAVGLIISGGGKFSLDLLLHKNLKKGNS